MQINPIKIKMNGSLSLLNFPGTFPPTDPRGTWQFCWWPFWDGEFTWPVKGRIVTSNWGIKRSRIASPGTFFLVSRATDGFFSWLPLCKTHRAVFKPSSGSLKGFVLRNWVLMIWGRGSLKPRLLRQVIYSFQNLESFISQQYGAFEKEAKKNKPPTKNWPQQIPPPTTTLPPSQWKSNLKVGTDLACKGCKACLLFNVASIAGAKKRRFCGGLGRQNGGFLS